MGNVCVIIIYCYRLEFSHPCGTDRHTDRLTGKTDDAANSDFGRPHNDCLVLSVVLFADVLFCSQTNDAC